MQLVLQPCGDSDALQHFVETIQTPVSLSRVLPFLTADDQKLVSASFGDVVAVWGVTPAKDESNARQWEKMEIGAIALLYRSKSFFFRATVAFKTRNEPLAVELWQRKPDGSTWEYVFFLTDLEPVEIDIGRFNAAAGYKPNFVVQRFPLLTKEQSLRIAGALDLEEGLAGHALSQVDRQQRLRDLINLDGDLDVPSAGTWRREQSLLREILLSGRRDETCVLCGKKLPLNLLWIGHIKKRHSCSGAERRDLQNVIPICLLGCDRLFENGYVHVDAGGSICTDGRKSVSPDLEAVLFNLKGRKCPAWTPANDVYFEWHRSHLA